MIEPSGIAVAKLVAEKIPNFDISKRAFPTIRFFYSYGKGACLEILGEHQYPSVTPQDLHQPVTVKLLPSKSTIAARRDGDRIVMAVIRRLRGLDWRYETARAYRASF